MQNQLIEVRVGSRAMNRIPSELDRTSTLLVSKSGR